MDINKETLKDLKIDLWILSAGCLMYTTTKISIGDRIWNPISRIVHVVLDRFENTYLTALIDTTTERIRLVKTIYGGYTSDVSVNDSTILQRKKIFYRTAARGYYCAGEIPCKRCPRRIRCSDQGRYDVRAKKEFKERISDVSFPR